MKLTQQELNDLIPVTRWLIEHDIRFAFSNYYLQEGVIDPYYLVEKYLFEQDDDFGDIEDVDPEEAINDLGDFASEDTSIIGAVSRAAAVFDKIKKLGKLKNFLPVALVLSYFKKTSESLDKIEEINKLREIGKKTNELVEKFKKEHPDATPEQIQLFKTKLYHKFLTQNPAYEKQLKDAKAKLSVAEGIFAKSKARIAYMWVRVWHLPKELLDKLIYILKALKIRASYHPFITTGIAAILIGLVIATIVYWPKIKKYIIAIGKALAAPFKFFFRTIKTLFRKIFKKQSSEQNQEEE